MSNYISSPDSFAVNNLYQKVRERFSRDSKEASPKSFTDVVSEVVSENIKNAPEVISKLEFKSGQPVPLDFFINLGFADSHVMQLVSDVLMQRHEMEANKLG